MLTKILVYSELLGKKSESKIKANFDNPLDDIAFDFNMPYDEAFEYFENLGVVNAEEFYASLSENAGRSFTISHINNINTLEKIQDYISSKLESGVVDPNKLKKAINAFQLANGDDPLSPHHIDTIVRNNHNTAFAKGRYLQQLESPNEIWGYVATTDGRETDLCNSLNGKAFPKTDAFWQSYYPPNHHNCRSSVVSIDKETAKEFGYDVRSDGKSYLDKLSKSDDSLDLSTGKGFSSSPDKGLDKWISKESKALGIDNVKTKEPIIKPDEQIEFNI